MCMHDFFDFGRDGLYPIVVKSSVVNNGIDECLLREFNRIVV